MTIENAFTVLFNTLLESLSVKFGMDNYSIYLAFRKGKLHEKESTLNKIKIHHMKQWGEKNK